MFPNGLSVACAVQGKVIGLSVAGDTVAYLHTSPDGGKTWSWKAAFTLEAGHRLVDVASHGRQVLAYTQLGIVYASSDAGQTWERRQVGLPLGELVDVAAIGSTWIACGTEGSAWSSDAGNTWVASLIPMQAGGYLTCVEACGSDLWGGGTFGTVRFNPSTRSWDVTSDGLPRNGSTAPTSIEIKELGGVLFGLFRNSASANSCYQWSNNQWKPVDQGGLPYGEQISKHRFSVWRNYLQVFCNGSDANLQGVYVVVHEAPTEVGEPSTQLAARLSPLPASDVVNVSTGDPGTVAVGQVWDALGNRVWSGEVNGHLALDVAQFANGTYHVVLVTPTDTLVLPLVIQH